MKKEFKVGDLVKSDGSIYKIEHIYGNDNFDLLFIIGNYYNKEHTLSLNKLEPATQADIDALQKNHVFKIGEKVFYQDELEVVISIDIIGTNQSYKLEKSKWVDNKDIKKYLSASSLFKVGDLVKNNGIIYKIDDINEISGYHYLEFVIGDYSSRASRLTIPDLEIATQADIDALQKDFDFKIGEEVLCMDKIEKVIAIDINDIERSYKLEKGNWVFNRNISDVKTENKVVELPNFKVGDLVKNNGIVYTIEELNGDSCFLTFVIGDFDNKDYSISLNKLEIATQVDIDVLQKNFEFKIGEEVLCGEKVDRIISIDTCETESRNYKLQLNEWVRNNFVKKIVVEKPIEVVKVVEKPIEVVKVVEKVVEKPKRRRLLLG